jgi:ribosomal protein L11 methyltransferase
MCLPALDPLPPGDAIDVGCGSGLLAQAWVRLGRGRVVAIDLDPSAVAQTQMSVDLAGVGAMVEVRHQAIETVAGAALTGATVLANVPAAAHHALLRRFDTAPSSVVLSGLRPEEAPVVLDGYRNIGMRRVRSMRVGRFDCHVMTASP